MRTSPIRNNHSIKLPFILQYIIQQVLIMATMLPFVLVIGSHNSPCSSFCYRSLKSRQIDFMKSPIIYHYINIPSLYFLIIQSKMFHTSSDTIFLYFLYIWHYHSRCQKWIFTHVFKITSIQGSSIHINSRT